MDWQKLKITRSVKMLIILICFIFSFISCGLDNVIYLEPPSITHNNYDSDDDSNKYLEFETSESKNVSMQDYIKGFEVYYRIYERKEERSSDYSSIYKYDEDNPSASVTYLLENKKYKTLSLSDSSSNDRPLIKKTSTNKKIRIRLIEYGEEEIGFYIDGINKGAPLRYNLQKFNKDDIGNNHEDVLPKPSSSSQTEDEYWYINMYASTYGNDKSFKPLYSKLEFIGFLKIKKQ